jgi:hypothetical protein
VDGIVSTRRSNGSSWLPITEKRTPIGTWELSLKSDNADQDKEIRDRFKNEDIKDILFVITYSARTPEWPA